MSISIMSEHCPIPGSECIDCLRAKVRRLEDRRTEEKNGSFTEGTLVMGDRIREDLLPPFRELVEWADNWLPDEAKDQGARELLRRCKSILNGKG